MANFSNKLCNPTPFTSMKKWEKGIEIVIPAFGSVDLSINQVNDFRPGQPGSEAVREELDSKGWFLLDPDRSYETQALEAIRRCITKLTDQLNGVATRLNETMTAAGQKEPAIFDERMSLLGYGDRTADGSKLAVGGKITALKKLEKRYSTVVTEQASEILEKPMDPTRTLFVAPGPQEFPSIAALEFFLDENPEIRTRHVAFMKQFRKNQDEATAATKRNRVTEESVSAP